MTDISENTPLLRSVDPESIGEQEPHDPPTPPTTDRPLGLVTALSWLSLGLSVLVTPFALAVNILDETHQGGGYYMPWDTRAAVMVMGFVALVTALISFLNLVRLYQNHRALWLWLNLIFDFVIAFYSLAVSGQGILGNWLESCSPASENCRLARQIEILTYLALGCGFALGIVHLILFLFRCTLAFRSRFWRGYQRWRLPAGRLTVEFTIKFLRQEGERTDEEQNQ